MLSETSAVSLQPSAFQILQDEWVMLAPLGDHPHELGIQRFTPTFIQNMANRFNGFFARMGRLFSGAPTFEGHHDIEPDKYPNSRSYGWIMALEARPDGLWGKMTWTPEGREMLQNGAFKFVSPVFIGKPISQENGRTVFEPLAFKSLALTNEPNLPLPPLANQKTPMDKITTILSLSEDASAEAICETAARVVERVRVLENQIASNMHLNSRERTTLLGNKIEAGLGSPTITEVLQLNPDATAEQIIEAARNLRGQTETLANTVTARDTALTTAQTELANAITRANTTQTRLIGMILDNAVRESRITLAQRDHWKTELEKDLATAEAQLANQQPALNTESKTRELGNQKNAYDTEATRRAALTAYIGEQMAKGLSYDDAWTRAKVERADVFANMKAK